MKSINADRSFGMTMLPKPRSTVVWMALLLLFCSSSRILRCEASAPVPETATETVEETSGSGDEVPKTGRFVHKTVIIPHDSKKFRGGEDAASTIDTMLVVADGVGGWANRGVNPGLYSRKLTETITSTFSDLDATLQSSIDLKKLVHFSNHKAAEAHLGSATCTVVRLKDSQTLETVNIGDSGYSIHRRSKTDDNSLEVVYASVPGQKAFNFPYQLGGNHGDQVDEPNVTDGPNTHTLQDKDVIVVVSDGVIDNMDPHEYHDCIQKYQWSTDSPIQEEVAGYLEDDDLVSFSAVADCIARTAYFLGKDKTYNSPFAKSAASYGKRYIGGKHDDITVVVAQVQPPGKEKAQTDPHKTESIFLYKDEDGPIQSVDSMPTMDDMVRDIIEEWAEKHGAKMMGVEL